MSKPPSAPPVTTAAVDTTTIIPRQHFDPWNSSSTGHQIASGNRLAGSTAWRQSRTSKLAAQFRGGPGGGRRQADSIGAGSPHFGQDGRKANGGWERGASGLRRANGYADVKEMLMKGARGVTKPTPRAPMASKRGEEDMQETVPDRGKVQKRLFDGLCFYINGSTAPVVSDHRLKHLIAENGGRVAIALARRSVTHVILGKNKDRSRVRVDPSSNDKAASGRVGGVVVGGAGGGLAAGKLQKKIQRVGGRAIKYVTVEWVLESLRCGKRVAETSFSTAVQLATSRTQKNIDNMMKTTTTVQMTKQTEEVIEGG